MQLDKVLACYPLRGTVLSAERYGDGHINDTFRVITDETEYLLQRVSQAAFKNPENLMENIAGVTAYLRERILERGGDPDRETLTLVPTKEGNIYLKNEEGFWRVYLFIGDTITYQQPRDEALFAASAQAFGRFMRDLSGYPAATLHETIHRFHDTPNRVNNFRIALEKNAAGRADSVQAEIDFVLARAQRADALVSAGLPLRVTHNDTKLNNVLMNAADNSGLCVIDLDTVMPGLIAYDFGDSIRFGANTAAEDEADLSKVRFNLSMFKAYAQGYLSEAGEMLTPAEIESLPLGAWMMTYECGVRFLTDYLDGDVYFRTHYPEHNLVRARNQFAMLADMEKQEPQMLAIVRQFIKE